MAAAPKTIEEAPVLRSAWAGRVARYCGEEFLFYAEPGVGEIAGEEKKYQCSAAFTKARTVDQAKSRLICVAMASSVDELKKCMAIERGKTFEEMRETAGPLYGPEKLEKGLRAIQAAEQTAEGNLFEQLASILVAPTPVTPPSPKPPPAAAPSPAAPTLPIPPKPVPLVRDVVAEIRKGLTAPPLTPLQITTFPVAVQECLKRDIAFSERVMDGLLQQVAETDRRGLNSESRKLQEFCAVLADAVAAAKDAPTVDSLNKLSKCLVCESLPVTKSPLLRAVLEA